jgi:hypothetical protein
MDSSILTMRESSVNQFAAKITALWTVFLLGTLFHTQLALMPLFHGLSVAESHTHESIGLDAVMWFMLMFFALPVLTIIRCVFHPSPRFRKFHFGLTLVYSILNFLHFILDITVGAPSYQLALMGLLFCIGLLLNLVSYRWIKNITLPEIA